MIDLLRWGNKYLMVPRLVSDVERQQWSMYEINFTLPVWPLIVYRAWPWEWPSRNSGRDLIGNISSMENWAISTDGKQPRKPPGQSCLSLKYLLLYKCNCQSLFNNLSFAITLILFRVQYTYTNKYEYAYLMSQLQDKYSVTSLTKPMFS